MRAELFEDGAEIQLRCRRGSVALEAHVDLGAPRLLPRVAREVFDGVVGVGIELARERLRHLGGQLARAGLELGGKDAQRLDLGGGVRAADHGGQSSNVGGSCPTRSHESDGGGVVVEDVCRMMASRLLPFFAAVVQKPARSECPPSMKPPRRSARGAFASPIELAAVDVRRPRAHAERARSVRRAQMSVNPAKKSVSIALAGALCVRSDLALIAFGSRSLRALRTMF